MTFKIITAVCAGLTLSACAAPSGDNMELMRGPPVQQITTAYDTLLSCLRTKMTEQDIAPMFLAVGDISDKTGRSRYNERETQNVTEGAANMAISAIQSNGLAYLVEHLDTRIADRERALALKQFLGDGKTTRVKTADGSFKTVAYRPVARGSVQGTQAHMQGVITALDYGVVSMGGEFRVGNVGPRAVQGRALIQLDLRVIDSVTLRTLAADFVSKQLVAESLGLGGTRFLGVNLVSIDIGGTRSTALSGIALRAMINRSIFNLMSDVYKVDVTDCRNALEAVEGGAEPR